MPTCNSGQLVQVRGPGDGAREAYCCGRVIGGKGVHKRGMYDEFRGLGLG